MPAHPHAANRGVGGASRARGRKSQKKFIASHRQTFFLRKPLTLLLTLE